MTTRADIISYARETTDTPWVHQGRMPHVGIDCAGVVLYVARRAGVTDFEPPPYDRHARWEDFLGYFQQHLPQIEINDARPGDVLIFRQEKYPCHCGIMTSPDPDGTPRFIHGYALRRKVTEERYTADWRKLTRAAFKYPNLED